MIDNYFYSEDILLAQLGSDGCLACRTKKCQWMPTVDEPVVKKRILELDKELERVKLLREAAVVESDVRRQKLSLYRYFLILPVSNCHRSV